MPSTAKLAKSAGAVLLLLMSFSAAIVPAPETFELFVYK
jgi:hypothetical protein